MGPVPDAEACVIVDRARFGGHRGVTAAPERQGD
jgi:hypothetical protein